MKKILTLTVAAATLLAFASCQKEGVYNPKKKIAKIYEYSLSTTENSYGGETFSYADTTPKHMTQEWTWDGKLLKSISYYNYDERGKQSVFSYKMDLTYDGKKLSKVSEGSNNYANYIYDGNQISKIESYNDGELSCVMEITHDGKKISKVVMTIYEEDAPETLAKFALNSVVPSQKVVETIFAHRKAKAAVSMTETIEFTYDGGNVSQLLVTYGEERMTSDFTYDEMKNPFQGNYALVAGGEGEASFINENNVLTERTVWSNNGESNDADTDTYTYEYDGKYPVSRTRTSTYGDGDNYKTTYTHTVYYEYAE